MPSFEFGANGRRPTAPTSLGPSFFLGKSFLKRKTTSRTYIAITRAASPIGGSPSTSSGTFYSTTSGPKDVANISTANTPSRGSCSNRGKLRLRLAWPPGGPSGPLARIGIKTIRIAVSKPLRLNGFTATSSGRARLPFRGACSPPCIFSISLMTEGVVAPLHAKGSPCTSPQGPHPNGFFCPRTPKWESRCRNPTLAKCGGEAQHLEKVRIWSPPGLPNV